jgi:prophage regulatory protein
MKVDHFVRKKEATQITGLSASTLRRLEIAGNFPNRRQLSINTVGWSLVEITQWMESRQLRKVGY